MGSSYFPDHLGTASGLARQDSALESHLHRLGARKKDLVDERATGRRLALEGVIDERTVEVAGEWVEADRKREIELRRLDAEIAAVQAKRQLVRDALVLAVRRWTFSNGEQQQGVN